MQHKTRTAISSSAAHALSHFACPSAIPERIQRKARGILLRYYQGERIGRKVKCRGKKDGGYVALKIDVGVFWRLLSLDKGKSWALMSHEKYNKVISQ
ncbi:hypothetical protein LV777_03955 [Providencia rettgeri]|uniref:ParE family toxin-like protein n=1 Tax=Providencia rettgeri TaxID=587 RepID=UPI0020492925|nr:hypothetical protein [Providencia rettgeri]UPQ40157.1 hypothetical protein LV777_03955 [Providencia rettgeri]